ncbi:MAG: MmgE/PrpD family protein [Betaproteobacteria bacterium]|nr:MmgE/PrpD family protein [Betaproteobacteria bacterium]
MNKPVRQEDTMIADSLSRFVGGSTLDSIPEEIRERAKYLMLDAIGVAYAASTYDYSLKTFNALHGSFGGGDSDVIGFSKRLALRDAVLMNGALIHGLDFDDTYTPGLLHATSSCFPCALGMAASLRRPGSDLLAAYILGMETAARISAVSKEKLTHIGFHPSGVVAAFACALIAGRLHALTNERLTMAQGIVLSMASGTREYSTDGAWSKRLHPGWAGVAGITAAALAKGGFVGPRAAYEGRFGLFATHLGAASGYEPGIATAKLGAKWEMVQVAVKPFPACQLTVSCLDAAIAIATRHRIDPKDVANIQALIQKHAVNIVCEPVASKRRPKNSYAAQFSIPCTVACALIHKKFGLAELEHYRDPEILALADKVDYSIDPTPGIPQHYNSGEVIVTMKNGQTFSHREQINRGGADRPMSGDEIVSKFMQNAVLVLPHSKAEQVRDAVLSIDRMPDVRSLSRALSLGE